MERQQHACTTALMRQSPYQGFCQENCSAWMPNVERTVVPVLVLKMTGSAPNCSALMLDQGIVCHTGQLLKVPDVEMAK